MQFTIFTTLAVLAASVVAVPTSGGHQNCRSGDVEKCCSAVGDAKSLLGFALVGVSSAIGINCVSVPVSSCESQAACCSGDTKQIGLVNVNVDLDCVQV